MMAVILLFSFGLIIGIFIERIWKRYRLSSFDEIASKIIHKADLVSKEMKKAAQYESQKIRDDSLELQKKQAFEKERIKTEQQALQNSLKEQKELKAILTKKADSLEKKEALLTSQLEKAAQMTPQEAKNHFIELSKIDIEKSLQHYFSEKMAQFEKEADLSGQNILLTAIERLSPTTRESHLCKIGIPNDDIKAKIIGKEGKNIAAFEAATGCTLLVDEAPKTIFISCFDPIRREIGRRALSELIEDGKINPGLIEQVVEKTKQSIDDLFMQKGKDAADRTGVLSLHPEIRKALGALYFKSSWGQNALSHSIEVSQLAKEIATALKLDSQKAARIGLLHDIGKALGPEWGASHAASGSRFVKEYGEAGDIATAIQESHDSPGSNLSAEARLCMAVDSISASAKGARHDGAKEANFCQAGELEALAKQFPGVKHAFCMQQGRELRVFIRPEEVDDKAAHEIAHSIMREIEKKNLPGKIQLTLIRETKLVEFVR